jgi:hypothetical protein
VRLTHGTLMSHPVLPVLLLAGSAVLAACGDATAPLELGEVALAKGGNGNGRAASRETPCS